MKNIIIKLFVPVFFALTLFSVIAQAETLETIHQPVYAKAKVLAVSTFEFDQMEGSPVQEISQQVTLKILNGTFRGKITTVDHVANSMMGGKMILKEGDKVVLFVDENPTLAESPDGSPLFHVADFVREGPIYLLAALFAVLLILVGGMKGVKSLISLVITVGLIFLILFPLTLRGFNPLLVSMFIAGAVSLIVFLIIGGKTVKSLAAAIGTLLGVAIAGLLAYFVGNLVHLTGMSSEEARVLLYSLDLKIDYQGLLFGSILIGALGAIMDVGMSIASSIAEVRKVHPEANFKNLFAAGMNVGRDVMGTMSNTLILAYTGSALPLLLLLIANDMSVSKILNLEMISVEVVRALAGSIGLVLCIPITAFVSALLYSELVKNK